jgi:rod shape-determining protein MreD
VKGLRDAVVLAVVLVLQVTLAHRIGIAGIRPDLLVAFVVYFGWMRGAIAGTVGGFCVGLYQDLDAAGPLGMNALSKAVVGFLVAKAGFRVHRSNVAVRFVFFFVAMLVHDLIYFGIDTAGDAGQLLRRMVFGTIPTALYTSVCTLLLLRMMEHFSHRPLLADEV